MSRFVLPEIQGEICWEKRGQSAYITWISVDNKGKGDGTTLLQA